MLRTVYLINENNEHCIINDTGNLKPNHADSLSILYSLV